MAQQLPRIVIFTTGGTIVSSGDNPTQMTGYSIRNFTARDLVASVPALKDVADIELFPISNIDSSSMRSKVWLELAAHIRAKSKDQGIAGFVVTHGTDTMEETAFFLHLVLKTVKPVVLTGAMRPSTAISADGPLNLLNAVRVAAAPQSVGKGVLIVLNDRILSARDAVKTDTTNAATFESPESGPLGYLAGPRIDYLRTPARRHTFQSEFDVPERLPRVDVILSHVDADDVFVRAALAAGAEGLVHCGTGNGSIHEDTERALVEAARGGVAVVRSTRAFRGIVTDGLERWQREGFVPAGSLAVVKARILLQLALTRTNDPRIIRRMFDTY
ncbi:MAG: asparaginase [Duodenibacillus sp.]|nr:asparaginase [Duodenibacillus sp.]